ncbi:GntR family transcriptional regulator [Pseudotabrizicola sp. L79]|uniref:GntR family transcriptional regulator n=1 Tax=Pseudotabrizicola sp. L79 TaxID=3118402 RepID=UPI002F9402D8
MSDANLAIDLAAHLRRDILRGALPPGAPIKERDNALELGVSRTPMREAIRILAQEGLVVLRPSRSPIVAQPGFKEIADQVAVLQVLEKLSAELACRHATEADLARIRAINDDIAAKQDRADPLDLFEIDMSFHTAIVAASGNAALAETHRSYLARLWRARFLGARLARSRARVVGEHAAIVQALMARDAPAARAAIEAHIGNLAEYIRPVIEAEEAQAQRPKRPD